MVNKLFCLLEGDSMKNGFPVDMEPAMTVGDLREKIKDKKSNDLDRIDADRLILWLVSIPEDMRQYSSILFDSLRDKEELDRPRTPLSKLFPEGPDDSTYIFVQRPPQSRQAQSSSHEIDDVISGKRKRRSSEPDTQKRKATKQGLSEDEQESDDLPVKRPRVVPLTWDFWLKKLHSTVEIGDPPELYPENLQKKVGRFRKATSQVPFSGESFVDLRLNDQPSDMGEKLNQLCTFNLVYVIFAVSGAGKTRSIFDVAMQEKSRVFLMYIECNDGKASHGEGFEPTRDRNFIRLCQELTDINMNIGLSSEVGQAQAYRLIILEYTSRIFHLALLFDKNKDLTPRGYLLSQLNGGQQSITEIKESLSQLDSQTLRALFAMAFNRLKVTLLANFQFAVAIDEATSGSNLFDGLFKNHNDHGRGVLTPLLEFIAPLAIPVLVSGTSFTLRHGEKVLSDIGKGVSENYISDYKPLTMAQVEAYIQRYLDLSGCDFTAIEQWKYLAGRPRLASRLVLEIVQAEENQGKSQTKQWVLEKAVSTTIRAVEGRLTTRLQDLAERCIDSVDPHDSSMRSILEDLFISCRFFGGSARLGEVNDDMTRLVNCGIAFVETSPNGLFIKVDELLAVRTVVSALSHKYFQPSETLILNLFKKLALSTKALDTSKGKAWEYLIMSRLLDYNGKSVSDLVHIFYNDNQIKRAKDQARPKILVRAALPGWTRDATFKVSSFGDADLFSQMYNVSHEDDVDIIDFLIGNPARRNYILQPANIMRPDGVYIGSINGRPLNQYWTLLFSAKFFSASMSGSQTIEYDRNSTKWALAYHTKTGIVSSQKLVDKLRQLDRFSDHQGSLRIHFVLPGLASSTDGSDRGGCRVEGDDVVMYIDKTMLDTLFQSNNSIAAELRKLL
ncbi:hypothetical protein EMPS_10675 [Entomortierella parvispora]|uniref:Crinkler effector protein N-terminal domain-containing protein n=1 Tax=Entomortierella parvispora TaxID=205924 RepID=A0A9P3HKI0_9FUNG|nr:hypothetical protein EMPS_10675 [Entomortierella parvispora]